LFDSQIIAKIAQFSIGYSDYFTGYVLMGHSPYTYLWQHLAFLFAECARVPGGKRHFG